MIKRNKFGNSQNQITEEICSVVNRMSKLFGDEQLTICGNQITSELAPKNSALRQYSDFYTASHEYIRGVTEQLKDLIRRIGKDRFNQRELKDVKASVESTFGPEIDPFSVVAKRIVGLC